MTFRTGTTRQFAWGMALFVSVILEYPINIFRNLSGKDSTFILFPIYHSENITLPLSFASPPRLVTTERGFNLQVVQIWRVGLYGDLGKISARPTRIF